MRKNYFQLETEGAHASLDIYGDITSWPWLESDVSSYTLSRALADLDPGIESIDVNINSYGGEVAEGLAIHNMLKRHPAKVTTYVDGFACSIASVIFMAGDERRMADASLLMIHNAWTYGSGDAKDLRKLADDMDVITAASKAAYLSHVSITEEELQALMDAETWITPEEALSMGFATSTESASALEVPAQSARAAAFRAICAAVKDDDQDDESDTGDGEGQDETDADDEEEEKESVDIEEPDDEEDPDPDDAEDGQEPDADDPEDESDQDADEDDDEEKTSQKGALIAFLEKLEIQ